MSPDPPSDLRPEKRAPYRRGSHLAALFAAVLMLPLLFVGGSVTTYRVGLAVPDWPKTMGINMFLYDFWNAPFGVQLEHSHRLYGAAVGLATVFLAVWFFLFECRPWVKGLGYFALLAVCIQGVLGGTRVTEVSTLLAAVHGSMGQLCFGLMTALVVLTGRKWLERPARRADQEGLRRRPLVILLLVMAQLGLGSWLRHYGTWAALLCHVAMALAVWAHALLWAARVEGRRAELLVLVPSARALAVLTTLQFALGVGSFLFLLPFDGTPRPISFYQALVRTGHQTTGALVLAAAVVAGLRAFGLFRRSETAERHAIAARQGLELEAAR